MTEREPLPNGVLRLILLRAFRSIAQGGLGVAFPLYLLALHISAVTIGFLFTASAAVSALMTLAVGILADRVGRKPFVALFAALTAAAGLVFVATQNFWIIAVTAVIAGFGRGGLGVGGGQGGPFAPALQAFLADKTGTRRRTPLFALAATVGAYAAAAGSAISGAADWLATPSDPLRGYQALFAMTALAGLLMLWILLPVTESPPAAPDKNARRVLSPESWRTVGKLSLAGAMNGLGWGFTIGFLPIWFHLRFGVGATAVGLLTAITALLAGPGFAVATTLGKRWGEVRTITIFRLAAPLILAAIPLSTNFSMAAILYIAGMLLTMAVIPLRQSFSMGVVQRQERAAASGLRATATRLPSAISPALSGYFIDSGDLALPFWGMAAAMAAGGVLYWTFFRDRDTVRPRAPG